MVNTNFYISIYWSTRNHGGDEEGGWSYWSREKARDIKRSFKSREQAAKFITKIKPILEKESGQWSWENKLQAFIFEAGHGQKITPSNPGMNKFLGLSKSQAASMGWAPPTST